MYAPGASEHACQQACPIDQKTQTLALRNLTVYDFVATSCLICYFIAYVSGVKRPLQQNWVWELMCSVDEYYMFAIVFVLYQQSCRGSWNIFYLDWLRSSLWLQFKPHHIAAGAAYLAAKFLNLDLVAHQNIWQEFQTTPAILQDVSQQLMELF
ncbi:hypothetical protein Patl1_25405 [Pistacia atlantica]|uniref:Uncharacterized protein n=1 Tax=Pistacia atlantica TaxID=434234 RepID=A0ACC1AZU7_9ROSI|nr:hypothetical protein Patl1_25405 [Pistacia atlantica]